MEIDNLQLSIETLRDLTDDELGHVVGGRPAPTTITAETFYCPTRGDTFSPCQPLITTNCA